MNSRSCANVLGWFGIGLGSWELLAPRHFADTTGLIENDLLFRLFGLREIGSGIAILISDEKNGPMWARVAGDALDSLVIAQNVLSRDADRMRVALTVIAVSPVVVADLWLAVTGTSEN